MDELTKLIEGLLKENRQLEQMLPIPDDPAKKKQLFRVLRTVRMPGYTQYTDKNWLKMQDEYLKKELAQKGGAVRIQDIQSVAEQFAIPPKPMYLQKKQKNTDPFTLYHSDKICLWQGDITRLAADAIVNAANARMLGCFVPGHHCVDNAIHSAAGIQLREECSVQMRRQGHEEITGFARMTDAYNLPCRKVLHTVGPIVQDVVTEQDETELRSCYDACLAMAEEQNLQSIAFCCISTGEYHFPKMHAAGIAIEAADEFLDEAKNVKNIIFCVFTEEDQQAYETLFQNFK